MNRISDRLFSPLKGNLLVLIVSTLIWTFISQMVSPYESIYIFALGGTGLTLGILSSIRTMFGAFLRVPGGFIADTRGRRSLIGATTIFISFAYLVYAFAQDWSWLIFGALLLALNGLCEPALEAIKAESVKPEERGRGYTLFSTIPQIPAMVAPVLGGLFIVDRISEHRINLGNLKTIYFLLFFGILLAGLIRLLFLRETLQPKDKNRDARLGFNLFKDVYLTVIRSGSSLRKLIFLSGFFMFCFHLDGSVRSLYAVNVKQLSTFEWGLIVSISLVVSTIAIFVIGWLVDKYGRKKVFIPSVAFLGVSSLIFALSNTFSSFLIAMVIQSTFVRARIVAFQVLIADSTPITVRGRVIATINILVSLGSSLGTLLSGILYDLNTILPFYGAAAMYFVAALTAMRFLQEVETKQL
jgi:MFS family permease